MRGRQRHLNPSHAGAVVALDSRFVTGLSDGDASTTWAGRLGTSASAGSTGTARPTYKTSIQGGNPVLRFDGVDDSMQVASVTLPTYCTNMAIVSAVGNARGKGFWEHSPDTNTHDGFYWSGKYLYYAGWAVNRGGIQYGPAIDGTDWTGPDFCLAEFAYDGTAYLYKNGAFIAGSSAVAVGTPRSNSDATAPLNIFARNKTTDCVAGDLGAVVIFASKLADPLHRRFQHSLCLSFKIPCS